MVVGAVLPMVCQAAAATLKQQRKLLCEISHAGYRQSNPVIYGASVSEHVRHILDHFERAIPPPPSPSSSSSGGTTSSRVIDYDRRERGTDVERSRRVAMEVVDILYARVLEVTEEELAAPVMACFTLTAKDGDDDSPAPPNECFASTCGREIAFATHHAIHHNATIGIAVRAAVQDDSEAFKILPDGFGLAPSTTAFLKKT